MAAPYEDRAEEVTYLLEQCGLARYVPAFRNDDVDDSCLDTLTPEDLFDLGLPMGPRVRLARAIRERNAAAASVAPSLPPPPPLPVSMRAATPPPRDDDGDDEDLCVMCMDSKIDCKLKPCEHALFCRACVANWRRQSAAKPKGPSCPKCREPFGAADVVDLEGRPLDAPRPMAWGGAAAPVVPFPGAAEAEARRRREAEARAAADADALRRRRESEAVRDREARRQREAETYAAAAEAEARRQREEAAAAARAADRAAAAAAARVAHDAAVDRDNAAAAVVSVYLDEAVASCRRDAAAAAIAAVDWERRVSPSGDLSGIEREILMVIDEHGGEVPCGRLSEFYREHTGKDLKIKRLSKFLLRIPGVTVVLGPHGQNVVRRWKAVEDQPFDDIERNILLLVDAHGGKVGISQLLALFRENYGNELDNKIVEFAGLSKLLLRLPGVAYEPPPASPGVAYRPGSGSVRRAADVRILPRPAAAPAPALELTAEEKIADSTAAACGLGGAGRAAALRVLEGSAAPAPAPSRSASPDPAAAPWTPAPPAAAVPVFDPGMIDDHPGIYSYQPVPMGAYVMPPPPPPMFYVPCPMPPMSQNPFVLQPLFWDHLGRIMPRPTRPNPSRRQHQEKPGTKK